MSGTHWTPRRKLGDIVKCSFPQQVGVPSPKNESDLVLQVEEATDDPVGYHPGVCTFGGNSWCATVGIDLSVEREVPLSRLLAGFVQSPLIEVRRTVLRVVADHRARKRASTTSSV